MTYRMACPTKKLIHGRPYHYLRECQAGITISTARMIERLAEIREVAALFPSGSGSKPHVRTVLSDLGAEQLALFEALDLARFRTP